MGTDSLTPGGDLRDALTIFWGREVGVRWKEKDSRQLKADGTPLIGREVMRITVGGKRLVAPRSEGILARLVIEISERRFYEEK